MALKNGSSGKLELPELIALVMAFEEQNSVHLSLTGQIRPAVLGSDLMWTAYGWDRDPLEVEAKCLVSASVRCLEKRLVHLEDVILQLLYALDFQLAEREFKLAEQPKA